MKRESKGVKMVKHEMRFFIDCIGSGFYTTQESWEEGLTRIYGFSQGVISMNEKSFDDIATLWEDFRCNMYILMGIYKPDSWKRIDGVFEERI